MHAEQKRLRRFQRLMQLDQLHLDEAVVQLRRASLAVEDLMGVIARIVAEQQAELARPHEADLSMRNQQAAWMEWSRHEQKKIQSRLELAENVSREASAEYQRRKLRVTAWEKLIEKMTVRILADEDRLEMKQSDELALIRRHTADWHSELTTIQVEGFGT